MKQDILKIKPTDRIEVDLEMQLIECNKTKMDLLRQQIAEKYQVPVKNIKINFKPITVQTDGTRISLASDIVKNVQDSKFQKQLMETYIKEKNIEGINFEEISTIDDMINNEINLDQYSKYKNYQFKYVKWSNYLSYGPDNYYDFTDLRGLVLLNSNPANQGGKTTFAIDLLRFALFGSADKSPNNADVFNAYLPEVTEVLVEVGLIFDNTEYIIRRTVTRPALKRRTAKSTCSQKVEFLKVIGENVTENCGGASVQETDKMIKDMVGNVDDYNLVISATNYTLGDLIRKPNTERGTLFSRWLGLASIKKKEEAAKTMWKNNYSKNLICNQYNIENLNENIKQIEEYITTDENNLVVFNDKLKDIEKKIADYQTEKDEVLLQKKPIREGLSSIDVVTVKNKLAMVQQDIENKKGQVTLIKQRLQEFPIIEGTLDDLQNQSNEYQKQIININAEIQSLTATNNMLRTQATDIKKEIDEIQALIQQGICPTCGEKVGLVTQQGKIQTLVDKREQIKVDGVNNKTKIESLQKQINDINVLVNTNREQQKQYHEREKLNLNITTIETQIVSLTTNETNYINTLEEIKNNEESIKFNNEIVNKINTINISLKTEENLKFQTTCDIRDAENRIKANQKEIERVNTLIKQVENETKIVRNWNLYLDLVGNNGIVKLVLRDALPIINQEVARILNGLCDFDVTLSIDEKNNVALNLTKGGISLDLGKASSGFEETMASLALRSALASVSTMSKPNFLCLDEVLQGVAVSNYDNVHELYKRIVNNYDFILHITHNEAISDWHDGGVITVMKENNISKIEKYVK